MEISGRANYPHDHAPQHPTSSPTLPRDASLSPPICQYDSLRSNRPTGYSADLDSRRKAFYMRKKTKRSEFSTTLLPSCNSSNSQPTKPKHMRFYLNVQSYLQEPTPNQRPNIRDLWPQKFPICQ